MENTVSVFISVVADEKIKTAQTVQQVLQINGVQNVWELTGSLDLLVLASSHSIQQLNAVVESIRACAGVKSSTTYLVLESHATKNSQ